MGTYLIQVTDKKGNREWIKTTDLQYAYWYIAGCEKNHNYVCFLYEARGDHYEMIHH